MAPMIPMMTPDDCDKPLDRHRDGLVGGVSTPGWFNVEVVFSAFDDFAAARKEFRDAGYTVELIDDAIDECSAGTTFAIVSKPAGAATCSDLFNHAVEFAARLGGWADSAWIAK